MAQTLADRLAEAFAELLHEKVRKDLWGYSSEEDLSKEALFAGKYQGIRPAPGYPACPDHKQKADIFEILAAEENAGLALTETYMMKPAASVSGFYFANPQAKYFSLGKIGEDQLEDYAGRNDEDIEKVKNLLTAHLELRH